MTGATHAQSTEMSLPAGDPVLAEIVRRLVDAYPPERIYLFACRGFSLPASRSSHGYLLTYTHEQICLPKQIAIR